MPNWKKVITSGSDAALGAITLSGNINPKQDNTQTLGTADNRFQINGGTPVTEEGLASQLPAGTVSGSSQVVSNLVNQDVGLGTGDITAAAFIGDGSQLTGISGYTHPTHDGDDINLDTGVLGFVEVISDLNIVVTTDGLGHVTDAGASYSTRDITATNLGLGNVDNTADSAKPVSTAQQSALDLKANIASPTFTGDIEVVGSTAGATVLDIQGTQGQLFSITDNLSTGDLFSVSDISGVPIFNVSASGDSYFTDELEVQGLLTGSTADFSTSFTVDSFVLSDSTDRTGLLLLDNNRTSGTWTGHQYTNDSGQLWSILGNDIDFGLYDDTNSKWALLYNINGSVELNHNGSKKIETTSGGVAVTGAITATGDITAYYSSDRRLKENIKPIENATEKIKKIGGYEFDWKKNDDPEMIHEGHDIGVIAQEVEAVLPEIVQDRDNGYKAVEYQKLVALLIESNKELAARVEELEKKIK